MITVLMVLWALGPGGAPEGELGEARVASADWQDMGDEYEERKAAAGKDVDKLWELYLWCEARSLAKEAKSTLWRIVRADDEHRQAHELLGHQYYDGRWFTSEKKLSKYKRVEGERRAKEEGLVKWKDEWVKPEDVEFLKRGLVKDELGEWVSKQDLERAQAGWTKQDAEWVSPEDEAKVEAGLWKCGNTWKKLDEANTYHGLINQWWRIPGDVVDVTSTCARETALEALGLCEKAMRNMAQVFGQRPASKPQVLVLKDKEQYQMFAAGNEAARLPAADMLGLSSIHYSFFAETWFNVHTGAYQGTGATYWDTSNDDDKAYGVHSVRHAAGLAYMQRLDPSPKWEAKAAQDPLKAAADIEAFWQEKRLPRWLWYGGAAYAERYYKAAADDPWWARKWSIGNILGRGGLRPVAKLLECELAADRAEDSGRMINELGLVISFMVDGDCEPVKAQHAKFKEAIASGEKYSQAASELGAVLLAHEKELRAHAGF
ncbi:MAG TPA: hypothetical protein QF730_10700 [Planctomycetota bacterium]|nr:hypothetical protein [Planctomycetota bacterium]